MNEDLPGGKVIVAGCVHGGLGVIRSLGRRAVHVVAMTHEPRESGLRSRYVDEVAICPHPRDDVALATFLLDRADAWRGALIIETNDFYASALAAHKAALSEHYRLAVADSEIAGLFIDKDQTYALAERVGVPHPLTFTVSDPESLEGALDAVTFPVLVKPVRSHEFVAVFRTKLFLVQDERELRQRVGEAHRAGLDVVVSEFIPGDDHRTLERVWLYVGTTGQVHVEVYTTKLRQTPPMFGINRVSVTTPGDPDLRELANRLLDASGLRGTAGFEFKRDPRDGKLKLIEVNVRMMADVQLPIAAGVDVPWIMYQDLVEDVRGPAPAPDVGRYFIYLLPDLHRFVSERDPASLSAFLEPYRSRRPAFAYLSLRDPAPFVNEVRQKVVKRFRPHGV